MCPYGLWVICVATLYTPGRHTAHVCTVHMLGIMQPILGVTQPGPQCMITNLSPIDLFTVSK